LKIAASLITGLCFFLGLIYSFNLAISSMGTTSQPTATPFMPVSHWQVTGRADKSIPLFTLSPTDVPSKSTPSPSPSPTPAQPATNTTPDPIIFFQGDLVTKPSMERAKKVVALIQMLIAEHPGAKALVASTGDNEQEMVPDLTDYEKHLGKTYGVFLKQKIFMPVRGNHDAWGDGDNSSYTRYIRSYSYLAKLSGPKQYNYSYELGNWHIVALDQTGGKLNAKALSFLKSDLAAHASTKCQLVYWHAPTYSSGMAQGDSLKLKPLNQAEYDAGVDIQINGHDHDYERFYPIDPDGQRDDAKGITTFITGIGGEGGHFGMGTSVAQAASAAFLDTFPRGEDVDAIGTVMFTLHEDSADYALYNAYDGTVLDQGTVACH
jgi:hypothetical protein